MDKGTGVEMDARVSLPSRIGVLGDVHGDLGSLVNAFQCARRLGISHIVQVGDFWCYDDARTLAKLDRQAKTNYIESLLFIDGNHENYTLLGERVGTPGPHTMSEVLTYLGRGTSFTVGSRKAVAIGGAASTDRLTNPLRVEGKGWWPREIVTEADAAAAIDGGRADIMFCHDVPNAGMFAHGYPERSIDTVTLQSEQESRRRLSSVYSLVEPSLVIHGHFHTAAIDGGFVCLGMNGTPGFLGVLNSDSMTVELM